MDRIIEKLDHGWWVVSHEQKLWLPKGELPYGEAANFDLAGQRGQRAGVGTTLHERLSSAGANALGGRGGLGTSGVRALYSKSALIQVNCG